MVKDSRIGVYKYVEEILSSVSENVYLMAEPQELTESDTKDGFIVISIGELVDASEFAGHAFGYARVFIECFVPTMSRGRVDVVKYEQLENGINKAVSDASEDSDGSYWIQPDSYISSDMFEESNANNAYHLFVKSFIVEIDETEEE